MNCENLVVVYWNNEIEGPVSFHGTSEIIDIHAFAKTVVPNGTHYNIVNKQDLSNSAIPRITNDPLVLESKNIVNLFYEYFGAL